MIAPNRQIAAHLQHGKRLHAAGRLAEAHVVYQQVLSAAPAHAEAMHMTGVLLLQTGQPDQALGWIERAIEIKGNEAEFHIHHAHALLASRRSADAAAACRTALRLKPINAEAHQVLGHALVDTGDYTGGLKAYQDAARLKPDLPDLRNNLGIALHHANRLEEAARMLTQAHGREPKDPGTLVNLSTVLRDLGRFTEAGNRLEQAVRLAPGDPVIRYDQALLRLLTGKFEAAWPGWEARFHAGAVPARGLPAPLWKGEKLNGRTLLIHAEQGLGDTIQFCRYPFPADGNVVFEVQPRITRLIKSRTVADNSHLVFISAGDPLPRFDLTCPLMSLPAVYHTSEATIPAVIPYLTAEPEAVERWRTLLGTGFRVGIAWQGNPSRREDGGRSIRLEHYLPLASVPGVRLISLQLQAGKEQLTSDLPIEVPSQDFDSGPDGFIETAAMMMNLDLIITSDTAVAHLAGALGRPVWVALRLVPDWRWLLERTDSPWYPTMRLFRQTARDEWTPVFANMQRALAELASDRKQGAADA